MSSGSLALKDITVVVDRGDQYNVSIRPSDNYNVSVTTGDQYIVNVMQPGAVRINGTGSYFSIADSALTAISASFAQTASYALNVSDASAFPFTGSAEISGSLLVTGGTISGSFSGDGSKLTGVSASVLSGGTPSQLALWDTFTTLTSSTIYESTSSIIINKPLDILNNINVSGSIILEQSEKIQIGPNAIIELEDEEFLRIRDTSGYLELGTSNTGNSTLSLKALGSDNVGLFINLNRNGTSHQLQYDYSGSLSLINNGGTPSTFYINGVSYDAHLATTGSNVFKGNQQISGSLSVRDNLLVNGRLTADEIVVSTLVSSSIIYESGSTKFGDTLDDTHQYTGSVIVDGTLFAPSITGSFKGDGSQLTGLVTDLRISGSTGNDVISLLTDTLSVLGTNGVTTTVTDNVLTINVPLGIISSSQQVDYTQLQNIPVGIVSSSAQATTWTVLSASYAETSSYTKNAETIDGLNSTVFATTGSNIFVGDQTVTGSLLTDADTLIFTGSILVDGTMEINTVITGSIVQAISASYIDGGFY